MIMMIMMTMIMIAMMIMMTTAIDINQQKNYCNIYNYLSSINIISILLLQGQDES